MSSFADIGAAQDGQPLGVGGHDAVLDAVVDHFGEVAGAVGPAVQVALLGGAVDTLAPRGARDVARPGGQRPEHRIEVLHGLIRAADHQAVAALQAPDTAARPDVYIMELLHSKIWSTA